MVRVGLGRGLEQEIVDHGLVGVGEIGEGGRQREHHVEVGHGQQLGFALCEPVPGRRALALGAMPIAAGNGRRPLPALWANP